MKKIFSLFAAVLFAGSMMAGEVLNTNFASGQGDWTINNVTLPSDLTYVWNADSYGYMKASAYKNGAFASESWLISPAINLSAASEATLAINHALNKGTNATLAVKATKDGSNWTDLTLSAWPAGTNWTFIDATADLSAFAGEASVKIAFVYVSTTENCPTWEVKTVIVTDGGAPAAADVTFLPADFADMGHAWTDEEAYGGEISVTKDGVTVATNSGYGHSLALRVYKDAQFSITSEEKVIGKIVFSFATVSGDKKDGGLADEITVNAKSWSVETMAAQARCEKIQIYFSDEQGIENIQLTEKARKVMVDGVVYIVRDGKMYNALGTQVR